MTENRRMVSGYRLSLPNRDLHRSQPDIGAHGSVATSLERSSRSLRAKPCSIDIPFRSFSHFCSHGCNIGPSVCNTLYGTICEDYRPQLGDLKKSRSPKWAVRIRGSFSSNFACFRKAYIKSKENSDWPLFQDTQAQSLPI